MHIHATAAPDRREAAQVSLVISGEDHWLGDGDRHQPLVLALRLPVSPEELAAALYRHDGYLTAADLADDMSVWGHAATVITQDGADAIEWLADEIVLAEAAGTLANPAWLAHCRRVAEVTGHDPVSPAALSLPYVTTGRAGAQPPATTTFPRPSTLAEDAVPPGPGTRAEGLAYVRALTEIASPCRAGN